MERKGKFTRGPVATSFSDGSGGDGYIIAPGDDVIVWGGNDDWGCQRGVGRPEDSSLIASAFNAATACEDMGYDGEACVKALPELVQMIMDAVAQCTQAIRILPYDEGCQAIDDEIRPMLRDILAKCWG